MMTNNNNIDSSETDKLEQNGGCTDEGPTSTPAPVIDSKVDGETNGEDLPQELPASVSEPEEVAAAAAAADDDDDSMAWTKTGENYLNGPDQILPSNAIRSTNIKGAVRIRSDLSTSEMDKFQPISVPSLLMKCADRWPNKPGMRVKRDGCWLTWTYKEYLKDVRTVAKGFIALGLEPHHSVCIIGINSPEWFISELATIFAGGIAVGVYTTNSAEACAHCGIDSQANLFVVEDNKQLQKILQIRDQLPHLKRIIQFSGEPSNPDVLSWAQLMTLGNDQSDEILNERLKGQAINQCCALIYSSGTTGNPKGVMLSHDNLTWIVHVYNKWTSFRDATASFQESMLTFLPLSHIAAQTADLLAPFTSGGVVTFADKNALKGSLVACMEEAKPTKFIAVPRVMEKIYEKIHENMQNSKGFRKVLTSWARQEGLKSSLRKMHGIRNTETVGFKIARKLVFSKVQEQLGLTNANVIVSAGAPINVDVLKFFMSLNILASDLYGLSECCGPHTLSVPPLFRLGSCGKTMDGALTKINNPDKDGNGEIMINGRHVCMGYLNQDAATKETIQDDGWLRSGDIGRLDSDGYLFVTGRIKEIIITAGGENIAPVPIEEEIKRELPLVSQAILIGDKLKFPSVLLTLKTEVNPATQEPLETLTPKCALWIQENGGCSVSKVTQVLEELNVKQNKILIQSIQNGIDRANLKAISRAQEIKKWYVLPKDFSIAGGELGPTMKLKRPVIAKKFQDAIAKMYKEE